MEMTTGKVRTERSGRGPSSSSTTGVVGVIVDWLDSDASDTTRFLVYLDCFGMLCRAREGIREHEAEAKGEYGTLRTSLNQMSVITKVIAVIPAVATQGRKYG
jgi:hypothetical protein